MYCTFSVFAIMKYITLVYCYLQCIVRCVDVVLCSVVTVMVSGPLSSIADEIVQQICEAVALLFSNDSSYEFCLDGLAVGSSHFQAFSFNIQ